MRTIFKYQPVFGDQMSIKVPKGAKLLTTQYQNGVLTFWFLVSDNTISTVEREFHVFGTGWAMSDSDAEMTYITTVQERDGQLVWHVFEKEME